MGTSDSKLSFCDGIMQLKEELIPEDSPQFWETLWSTPITIFEASQFITPADIRSIRDHKPENMRKLLTEAVGVISRTVAGSEASFDKAQNVCRVVARVVPILLEHDSDGFVESCLWDGEESLGKRLALALVALLFVPNCTIYPAADEGRTENGIQKNLLWMSSRAPTKEMDQARNDVLRCILACSSNAIYTPLEQVTASEDRFMRAISSVDNPLVPTMTFSLVNVVFSYDPVGWGVPYNGQMFNDTREPVVDTALHVLLLLLKQRFRSGSTQESGEPGATEGGPVNMVAELISNMNRPETLGRLYDGFVRLLLNPMEANNTWMPYSMKQIRCHQELLLLFWEMIDINPVFVEFILTERNCCDVVTPVVYLMVDARKDPAKIGLLNVCTFILLRMSGHREFGVQLNKPLYAKLPTDLPSFTGNHADLLIIAAHKLVVDGLEKGDTLIDTLLTVVCNVSPYIGAISMVASMRLLGLFEIFSTPRLLLTRERAHQFASVLLEVFNNVIQYQYAGNPHIVYAIVRRRPIFEKLVGLSLSHLPAPPPPAPAGAEAEGSPAEDTPAANAQAPQQANEFVPTAEWLEGWKSKLPLEPIQRLLEALSPKIEQLCQEDPNLGETQLLDVIRETTMVGLLPVPHQILVRKYVENANMNKWFTAYIWGTIYMRNQSPPLFDSEKISLFTIFYKPANAPES